MINIREVVPEDLGGLLELYTHLNSNTLPKDTVKAASVLERIIKNQNQHLLIAECDGDIAATVNVTVIENLTHELRPYALVEHVVTREDHRGKGLASMLLAKAKEIAIDENCYKIMLITGHSEEHVHHLYQKAGFSSVGKTAYVLKF